MVTHSISLTHLEDDKFDIIQNDKVLRIDAGEPATNTGFRPKALILSALAGCTAIDVVDLLRKMRVEYKEFKIEVSGELTEEHPKTYHTINLTYLIKLTNEDDKSKMEKAVKLSQGKYCGVTAMVKKFATLNVHINYL